MKKLNLKYLKYVILAGLLSSANVTYAFGNFSEVKPIAAKYFIAMMCVAAFSIIIFLGLSIYNKLFVAKYIKDKKLNQDSLHTPADKDNAIMGFIYKNKLK